MAVMSRARRTLRGAAAVTVAALTLGVGPALPAAAASQAEGVIENAGAPGAIKDRYIVVLGKGTDAGSSKGRALAAKYGARVKRTYDAALNGYAVELTEKQAKRFAADPAVESVVQDQVVKATGTQPNPPSWGLDRIDQSALPLDSSYKYPDTAGRGVTAYIIDTGVHISHQDFGGRASYGYDAVDGDNIAEDGNGHGTHVAGTVAGSSYGVAKEAKIVAVRVLDNAGSGSTSGVIAGVDWVTANAVKPAVVNMSLGGGTDTALDAAVRNSIASGVTYAVAAGNENRDATTSSPARVAEAITVGSTTSGDARSSFSNFGGRVDVFAPGSAITSTWHTGDTATNTISGTSMASPHVAGAAALYLAQDPSAPPSLVAEAVTSSATTGVVTDPAPGSPNLLLNVTGLRAGPHGTLTGTVTDGTAPLAAAKVTVGDSTVTTDGQGRYTLTVRPPGTYDVSVSKFGYATKTVSGVAVADGQMVTENFALTAKPSVNVTGTVHDGSGHGWPLYATVRVKGEPTSVAYTDPRTGKYTLSVPVSDTYTLQVDPLYPGYQQDSQDVQVGSTDVTHDVDASVNWTTCNVAGYGLHYDGTTESFDGTTTPSGWTVDDKVGNGQTWVFDDPGKRGNKTGGSGGFAIIDSQNYGDGQRQDSSLISPVMDFSRRTHPALSFRTDYFSYSGQTGDVDLSVDGGQTWKTVWHHGSDSVAGPRTELVDLSQAAGKANVQVRFHFTSTLGWWWQLDDVFLGDRTCDPAPGALVLGQVTDKNTGAGINGATVTSADKPTEKAIALPTPNDPNLGDGFYRMFSSLTGEHKFTATAGNNYGAQDITVNVAPHQATDGTFVLTAPRIEVSPAQVSKTVDWQGKGSSTVTLKNTGTAPVTANIGEWPGGHQPAAAQQGAPLHEIKGHFSPEPFRPGKTTQPAAAKSSVTPQQAPWTTVPDYPTTIHGNAVVTLDGKVYSFGGGTTTTGALNKSYVYDPVAQAWSALPDMKVGRQDAQAAAYGGKIYVFGGLDAFYKIAKTEIYDPASRTWSEGAENPKPYFGAAVTMLGGKIYIVGGCSQGCYRNDVQVYDPASDSWSSTTPYPETWGFLGCGTIANKLYCAGGTSGQNTTKHAYSYDPASATWTRIADLPIDLWAMGYSVGDGKLLMSGGVTNGLTTITNRGFAYDPGSDTWTPLPNSNNTVYRGGSACGFYKIGGITGPGQWDSTKKSELLPGYCATDVPWLSVDKTEVTIQPGESVDVNVSFNANVAEITQPGTFTSLLTIRAKTPYQIASVPVALTVNPPKTWGKITGTVTGVDCAGKSAPMTGATVQITSKTASYTLKTDQKGQYVLWLDVNNSPLTVTASRDGWESQTQSVRIRAGKATAADFSLKYICT